MKRTLILLYSLPIYFNTHASAPKQEGTPTEEALHQEMDALNIAPASSNSYDLLEFYIDNLEKQARKDLRATLNRTPTPQESATAVDAEFAKHEKEFCEKLIAYVRKQVNRTPTDEELSKVGEQMLEKARQKARVELNRTPTDEELYDLKYFTLDE